MQKNNNNAHTVKKLTNIQELLERVHLKQQKIPWAKTNINDDDTWKQILPYAPGREKRRKRMLTGGAKTYKKRNKK